MLQWAQTIDGDVVPHLDGVADLLVIGIGGSTLIVALSGSGLGVFTLGLGGTHTHTGNVAHPSDPYFLSGITPRLIEATGSGVYIAGTGMAGDGRNLVASGPGAAFSGSGPSEPLIAPARVDGMILGALQGGGIVTWREDGQGALTELARLDPAGGVGVPEMAAMAVARMDDRSFLLGASASDHSLMVLEIGAAGELSPVSRIGAGDGLGMSVPGELEVAEIAGATYAVIGSAGSSSLSVVRIAADGAVAPADHVFDTLDTRFSGLAAMDLIRTQGFTYLAAGGADDGISLFGLLPGGYLVHLASFADTTSTTLTNTDAVALAVANGALQIVAAGQGAAGLTRLSYGLPSLGIVLTEDSDGATASGTGGADWITGTGLGGHLVGGAGDDILFDATGTQTLSGGAGADRFVIGFSAEQSVIEDFQRGVDRLDLSHWPFFSSASQLEITPLADGAGIGFRGMTLLIRAADGAPLTADDIADTLKIGPYRPPMFVAGQTLSGSVASDTLIAGLGPDLLNSGDGDDLLRGAQDDDTLFAGAGEDVIEGGDGNDMLNGQPGFDTLLGGPGQDVLYGGPQADTMHGGTGNDSLLGGPGDDFALGEDGDDWLNGGDGQDRLFGDDGDDTLFGGEGEDRLTGDDGADTLMGQVGFDTLVGGAGADNLEGGPQADFLFGGAGGDGLWGGPGFDRLYGEAGADLLFGEDGDDRALGGGGNDTLSGGFEDAAQDIADGNDSLYGGGGNDCLRGGAGDDLILGQIGFDRIEGGAGDDSIDGGPQADTIFAGPGHDTLIGGPGNDFVAGDDGADALEGGDGNDRLNGGAGDDTLTGGGGADTFIFAGAFGQDRITDFAGGEADRIDLHGASAISGFATLAASHMVQAGADVVITTGAHSIVIEGVLLGSLGADDFLF